MTTAAETEAAEFNELYPIGTPVAFWPGARAGDGRNSVTTTPAWVMGGHSAVVTVADYSGGIALSHIARVASESMDTGNE